MKCLVPSCDNDARSEEHMCRPCFDFLTTGIHGCSQVETNVLKVLPSPVPVGRRVPVNDYWSEDPAMPLADWQHEVANGDTRQGYWEWVLAQKGELEL